VRTLHKLEEKRNSRVIALIHRQETLRFLGFPLARYIDIQDSEEVLRAIKLTDPQVPIDLILHTPGGLVLAAGADRIRALQASGQSDGVRPPLRYVGWDAHRPGCR